MFQFAGVVLPFLGLPVAIILLWGRGVSAVDLAIMASLYTLQLTHRAFQTYRWLRYMCDRTQCLGDLNSDRGMRLISDSV